jgi:NitT/TauT family transport system substrate-binding protein
MRATFLALGVLGLSVACVPASPQTPVPPPSAIALQTVKMVHVPSILFAPLYVALAKGYLREQGIDLQLDRAGAGQDAMPLVASGQLDVVVGGFSAATFNAVARQLDLRIVASMGRQPHKGFPSALMVRKDLLDSGAVKDVKDLRGRKVALSGGVGATGSYWMTIKLRPAGMTLKDIELINMGFPDMVAAFKSGAIDAAFPSAPATTQIRNAGTADYFGGVTQPGASAVGVTYGGGFIKSRPDVARKLLMGLIRGARDVQGENYFSADNLQAYSTYTDTPIDTLKGMDPYEFDPDLGLDLDTLQDMQRVFISEGVQQTPEPIPPSTFTDQSFLAAAVKELKR